MHRDGGDIDRTPGEALDLLIDCSLWKFDERLFPLEPSRQSLDRNIHIFLVKRTFPHDADPPTQLKQLIGGDTIPRNCLRKLLAPERGIRCRSRAETTSRMSVPETSVNLNCRAIFGENNVRTPRQVNHVKAISKAFPMQRPSYRQLRLGIPSLNPRHHPRPGGSIYNINHSTLPWRASSVWSTYSSHVPFEKS
jgi:hypothetical protein